MNDNNDVDKHLDAVLRAAGSGLRYYSMQLTLDNMRTAMARAMHASGEYPLSWLPNQAGFTFLGVTHDNVSMPCEIVLTEHGYRVADGKYRLLRGWRVMPPAQTTAGGR